ncbi:hypothetical protein Pmani_010071 [Petrolisthes manimaculis]|uniref:Uncharacterized protein n=1 Tax=Petrolisthes manimaculis TaxID=1843537 RepID=A0AAE1Q293_9EUCA|nr:hypothetical protein Pmani_010071 [Petrolisthes manimaculis]
MALPHPLTWLHDVWMECNTSDGGDGVDSHTSGPIDAPIRTGPDVITNLALQDFLKLRVGCWHLYYHTENNITFPLSVTSFKWGKQPKHLKKKGGECWVELSTNNDDEAEEPILDLKCPYDLPEFPQLQLTVKCPPDDVEQCATINYCNTKSEATTVNNPTHCDVMNIPHLEGYKEPLQYHHHYYNNNNNNTL